MSEENVTKKDVEDVIITALSEFRQEVNQQFDAHRQEFKQQFDAHRQEFNQQFDNHKQEVKQRFDDHKQEVKQQFDDLVMVINHFADATEQRFENLESKTDKIEATLSGVVNDLQGVTSDMQSVKSQMVTKDYLDEKLYDLKGDMVLMTRKEDMKVRKLVDLLEQKNILSKEESGKILSMEPFPQLSL